MQTDVLSKRLKTELKRRIECLPPETNPGSWFDRRVRIVLLETLRALRVCTLRERCCFRIIQYYKTLSDLLEFGHFVSEEKDLKCKASGGKLLLLNK